MGGEGVTLIAEVLEKSNGEDRKIKDIFSPVPLVTKGCSTQCILQKSVYMLDRCFLRNQMTLCLCASLLLEAFLTHFN